MNTFKDLKLKKNNVHIAIALLLLLFVTVFGAVLRSYIADSRSQIDSFSRSYLSEMLTLVDKSCSDRINCNYKVAGAISQYINDSLGENAGSLKDFNAYFDSVAASKNLSGILFLQDSGRYLSSDGSTGQLDMGNGLSELFIDGQNVSRYVTWRGGEVKYAFAVPSDTPFNMEGLMYNAAVLLFDVETIASMMNIPIFDKQASLYILDKNGVVIFSGNTGEDTTGHNINLLSKYEKNGFVTQEEKNSIVSDFARGRSMTRIIMKDKPHYFSYMKMQDTPLNLVCEIEVDRAQYSMTSYQNSMNKNAVILFATILLMVLTVIFYIWRHKFMEARAKAKNARILLENNIALQQANDEIRMTSETLAKKNAELMTTKNRMEEALHIAEDANHSKSNFLSNMSHDIRTPMNAIVGFSTLLARDAENPERVREYTKKIKSSSQHLLGLINDVLDMSKIEAGKTTLNLSEESFGEIIEGIDTIVRPQMRSKNHRFDVIVRDIRHEVVIADKLRLNQILLNLLSNAVKYTPEGGHIVFTVQELPQRSPQFAFYRFIVEDNGLGMNKEFSQNIFDAFSREENSVTNRIQGTGLGMAITKNLVDLMGGTISVKSHKNVGSVFTVELELRIGEHDIDHEYWKDHDIKRLLVVDDNQTVGQNIKIAMENTGVQVDYAPDGDTAADMVKTSDNEGRLYNIALIDWHDGVETASHIRHEVPKDLPILVLSSYDWADIENEAREAGISTFLPKPFFVTNLRTRIDALINKNVTESAAEEITDKNILEGMHMLVAEDNELNSEILKELLDMAGATCDIFANGRLLVNAFEKSKVGQYDAILMDVQMPVMNGYDATKAIRDSNHPSASKIPIIAMTANAFAEDINNALEAGMNGHVAKPVDMALLADTVKSVLEALKE